MQLPPYSKAEKVSDLVLRRPHWSRRPLNHLSRIKKSEFGSVGSVYWTCQTEALTQRLFSCRGLESLSLQVRGSQRRFSDSDFLRLDPFDPFRCFFIHNIVVFLQIQILQIRLPKVFPAGMCDSCQQTCRSHETELFRNTAKHGADKKH